MEGEQAHKASLTIGDAPSIIAIVSGYCVLLSLARQIGFFWQIDLGLLALFSISDIVANSLQFAPLFITAIAITSFLIRSNIEPPELLQRAAGAVVGYPDDNHKLSLKIGFFVVAVVIMFTSYWPTIVLFSSFHLYASIRYLLEQRGVLSRNPYAPEIFMSASLIYNCFLLGAIDANRAIGKFAPDYYIQTQDNSSGTEFDLLRLTQNYAIVLDENKHVSAIPLGEITKMTRLRALELQPFIDVVAIWRWIDRRFRADSSSDRR